MNFVLLLSLLQAWVIFTDSGNGLIVDRLAVVESNLHLLNSQWFADSIQQLNRAVSTPSDLSVDSRRQWHRQVPLSLIRTIKSAEIADIEIRAIVDRPRLQRSAAEIIIRDTDGHDPEELWLAPRRKAVTTLGTEIGALQEVIMTANLSEKATVGELERSRMREIEIPVLNEKVEARGAWRVLTLGTFAIMLFLTGIISSMAILLNHERDITSLDWTPLYPSRLGHGIGVAWILAPAIVLLLGVVNKVPMVFSSSTNLDQTLGYLTVLLFLVLATYLIYQATKIRATLHRRRTGTLGVS